MTRLVRGGAWCVAALASAGCGGSASSSSASGPEDGGAGAAGGGGASGSGGAGGGAAGAGAASGAAGAGPVDCAGRTYCECVAEPACEVLAEACFCPCGAEPCEPSCACGCGGGRYLGCGPAELTDAGTLLGLWLIGWSGGLHHFSWVRFESEHVARFGDGAGLSTNLPLWPCAGAGEWAFSAQPDSVLLELPPGCGDAGAPLLVRFVEFVGRPAWPKGALLEARVELEGEPGPLTAYKLPASVCDVSLASCSDPFAY